MMNSLWKRGHVSPQTIGQLTALLTQAEAVRLRAYGAKLKEALAGPGE